jgi:hypothetical protein
VKEETPHVQRKADIICAQSVEIEEQAEHNQHKEETAQIEQTETGVIPGCVETLKRRNGSFKCVQCEDGYRVRRGKCVEHQGR